MEIKHAENKAKKALEEHKEIKTRGIGVYTEKEFAKGTLKLVHCIGPK